jgi:hypothetical protein
MSQFVIIQYEAIGISVWQSQKPVRRARGVGVP